jgi:two-component system, NtrC family, sensor kinase
VQADTITQDGPADRAGIQPGDILLKINGLEVASDRDVTRILYDMGPWSHATYSINRAGILLDVPLVIAGPPPHLKRQRLYLEIIGLFYFLAGVLVLIRRFRAPHAIHFYFVCLTSFVLFVYSFTGKLDTFDWTIFWLDLAASALLPPLFLHFCLNFPVRKELLQQNKKLLLLLYTPGVLILLSWILFVYGIIELIPSPLILRNFLETISDVHFGAYFVLSAFVLFRTYRSVHEPELRQQLKWVTRGTAIAVLPYFLLQTIPRIVGIDPDFWVDASIFPLILIPTSFGYAIQSYRLMDVDIIFKRGVTYTLATASVIGLYATLVVLVGELLGSGFEPAGTVVRVAATIMAALLFAPIKDQFQIWLDKFFYRDRYGIRRTLIDFGRTLGSEVRSENMLGLIVDRLSRALSVDRTGVFLEDASKADSFKPAFISGFAMPPDADLSFLKGSTDEPYLFFRADVFGLNFFIPCRVKDRVIAYIGLGRTQKGDFLTSEDLELLETMADYIGIALENALLYKSLEQKATEYHDLKDFSENIIESINVGVVVENVDGVIVGWNHALENLTGRRRSEMLGKQTEDVIPDHFLQRLSDHRSLYKQPWNGLTVNFSMTSLVDKSRATRGRLIIVDDITDRVRLEDQLIQNEKLTSIGLLAAGVAHEVNTPLAVISSYSQMLRKQIGPQDSGHKLLDKITKQTFRASEIVNSLLSFSRTNATEFSDVAIHQVIGDTLSLLEHQLKSARIRIDYQPPPDNPVMLGNPGKLQQVFLNLFLNAKDAMGDGGELRIRVGIVDSRVEIIVSDTGMGISRDNVKKIYDPFFTTKIAGKGTGLGLSVSYGIVQEHNGFISVESKLGSGTSFRLEFPLARKIVNV